MTRVSRAERSVLVRRRRGGLRGGPAGLGAYHGRIGDDVGVEVLLGGDRHQLSRLGGVARLAEPCRGEEQEERDTGPVHEIMIPEGKDGRHATPRLRRARLIARGEGSDVSKTDLYSFEQLTSNGKPFHPGYVAIGFDINGNARNLILISDRIRSRRAARGARRPRSPHHRAARAEALGSA